MDETWTVDLPDAPEEKVTENEPAFSPYSACPDLPREAVLTAEEQLQAMSAGCWVDKYAEFALKASPMTPPLFHRSYALAALSTAVARRVYIKAGDDTIFPNLYMLLVAPSTLYAKTTGLNVTLKLLEMAGLNNFLLPTGVTPQSLISELTHKEPPTFENWHKDDKDDWRKERPFAAQRAWWMDEAASLLDLFKQKNTADLLGLILKLYGTPAKLTASTMGRGRETVRFPYLSICGPTTPAAMRTHLNNSELWGDGLFARFLFVTPDAPPVDDFYSQSLETPPALAQHLNTLAFARLEIPQENITGEIKPPPMKQATIPPEVWAKWKAYRTGLFTLLTGKRVPEKLFSLYGRLHTSAMKIAILLAASDWAEMAVGNPLIIQPAHWARAQMMTEEYRASLHRMVEDASRNSNDEDQQLEKQIIARAGSSRNSRREIGMDLHMSVGAQRVRLDFIIDQLLKDGVLEERETKKTRGPGTKRLYPL